MMTRGSQQLFPQMLPGSLLPRFEERAWDRG